MKIYVGHSTSFDYIEELYVPLKQSSLWGANQIILPHDKSEEAFHSRTIILNCDIFIAEVTYPSTGLGIELGWASDAKLKIICAGKEGVRLSSSLAMISDDIIRFTSRMDMINKLSQSIKDYSEL